MQVHYLEVVSPDVDAVCANYAQLYGVTFGDPVEALGNARTASLSDGSRIGVRAPMHESEEPIVRPYFRVDDLERAVKLAEESGAEIALPFMELPGEGKIAIFIQGGVHHGLWQV